MILIHLYTQFYGNILLFAAIFYDIAIAHMMLLTYKNLCDIDLLYILILQNDDNIAILFNPTAKKLKQVCYWPCITIGLSDSVNLKSASQLCIFIKFCDF